MNNSIKISEHTFIGYQSGFLFFIPIMIVFSYFFLDRPAAIFFNYLDLPVYLKVIIQCISNLGFGWIYLIGFPVCATIALKCFEKRDLAKTLMFLWFTIIFSSILCTLLKSFLGRARPIELFHNQVYGFYFFQIQNSLTSFPSGHSTMISSIMFTLCYLKPKWSVLFISTALIISFTRIVLAEHYLSDVMAGFYVSILSVHFVRNVKTMER